MKDTYWPSPWFELQKWIAMSTMNTSGSHKFSSDRTICEYARDIWGMMPSLVPWIKNSNQHLTITNFCMQAISWDVRWTINILFKFVACNLQFWQSYCLTELMKFARRLDSFSIECHVGIVCQLISLVGCHMLVVNWNNIFWLSNATPYTPIDFKLFTCVVFIRRSIFKWHVKWLWWHLKVTNLYLENPRAMCFQD